MKMKEVGYNPKELDVLCGRGAVCYKHPGNRRFRQVICHHVHRYMKSKNRLEKSDHVVEILAEIRAGGGQFLKKQGKSGWCEIGDKLAREKIGHALRDAQAERTRQKDKQVAKPKRQCLGSAAASDRSASDRPKNVPDSVACTPSHAFEPLPITSDLRDRYCEEYESDELTLLVEPILPYDFGDNFDDLGDEFTAILDMLISDDGRHKD